MRQNPVRANSERLAGKLANNKPAQKTVPEKGGTLEKFQDVRAPVTVEKQDDRKRDQQEI